MIGVSNRHCNSISGTDRMRFMSSSSNTQLLSSDVPMFCDNCGLVVRYVDVRSCRIRIGLALPEYGLVSVTASVPPIIVPPAPPPHDDNDADDAWLLLFDDADISDTLVFGPFDEESFPDVEATTAAETDEGAEEGPPPPPSKLREANRSLGANMTGAGVLDEEVTSREAVSSELP